MTATEERVSLVWMVAEEDAPAREMKVEAQSAEIVFRSVDEACESVAAPKPKMKVTLDIKIPEELRDRLKELRDRLAEVKERLIAERAQEVALTELARVFAAANGVNAGVSGMRARPPLPPCHPGRDGLTGAFSAEAVTNYSSWDRPARPLHDGGYVLTHLATPRLKRDEIIVERRHVE